MESSERMSLEDCLDLLENLKAGNFVADDKGATLSTLAADFKHYDKTQERIEALELWVSVCQEAIEKNARWSGINMKATYYPNNKKTLPKLLINQAVEPSTDGHNAKKSIPDVPINLSGQNECWDSSGVIIPTEDTNGHLLESDLGIKTKPLEYANEIGVQVLVQSLVNDAIKCLGYEYKLKTHMEVSLYGYIPDIIVVTLHGRIIFTIEVKSPERGSSYKDNVFENAKVGGQIWLYLMVMKQLGVANPLGAIMTYNKMRIVSLKDFDCVGESIVQARRKLCQTKTDDVDSKQSIEKGAKDNPSPLQKAKRLEQMYKEFKGSVDVEEVQDEDGGWSEVKKELFGSEVFKDDAVFSSLLLALSAAYIECGDAAIDEFLPHVTNGDELGNRIYAVAKEESLTFGKLSPIKASADDFLPSRSKIFFFLARLGTGKNGEVHVVCNTSGRLAAAKLYVYKRSQAATNEEREKENAERISEKNKIRDMELKLWEKLYGPSKAYAKQLNGVPALIMPYGRQLLTEGDREESVVEIRSTLIKFAQHGWMYDQADLRWRQIVRYKGSLLLVELDSLVNLDGSRIDEASVKQTNQHIDTARIDEVVEKQMNGLRARIGNDLEVKREESAQNGTVRSDGSSAPPQKVQRT